MSGCHSYFPTSNNKRNKLTLESSYFDNRQEKSKAEEEGSDLGFLKATKTLSLAWP